MHHFNNVRRLGLGASGLNGGAEERLRGLSLFHADNKELFYSASVVQGDGKSKKDKVQRGGGV